MKRWQRGGGSTYLRLIQIQNTPHPLAETALLAALTQACALLRPKEIKETVILRKLEQSGQLPSLWPPSCLPMPTSQAETAPGTLGSGGVS